MTVPPGFVNRNHARIGVIASSTLTRRVWMATVTRAHAVAAARDGLGLITNFRPSTLDEANRDYPEAYCSTSRVCGYEPRVALSRGLYPTKDPEAARRTLLPHAHRFTERGRRLGWLPASFTVDQFFDRDDFHFGHPDLVLERLSRDPGLPYATDLLTGMLAARMSPRELIPVMESIATDVAPALGWRAGHA